MLDGRAFFELRLGGLQQFVRFQPCLKGGLHDPLSEVISFSTAPSELSSHVLKQHPEFTALFEFIKNRIADHYSTRTEDSGADCM